MTRGLRFTAILIAHSFWIAAVASAQPANPQDDLTVGLQRDGRIVVPTNQVLKPAGTQFFLARRNYTSGKPRTSRLTKTGLLQNRCSTAGRSEKGAFE
jgi:hypothetical protein